MDKKYQIDYIVFSNLRSSIVTAPSKQEARKRFKCAYYGFACILDINEV